MKTLRSVSLLLLAASLLGACASEPPHRSAPRKFKLETIYRPHRPPIYVYREVR